MSPAECPETLAPWGSLCPQCGQRLPQKPKPLQSWKSAKAERLGRALQFLTDEEREKLPGWGLTVW